VKKFTKDIRFLIVIFVSVFVVLGGLVIGAVASSGATIGEDESVFEPGGDVEVKAAGRWVYFTRDKFEFKLGDKPVEGNLFIGTADTSAITRAVVDGDAIGVTSTSPFIIELLRIGTSRITLHLEGSARKPSCTVHVLGEIVEDSSEDGDEGEIDEVEEDERVIKLICIKEGVGYVEALRFILLIDGKEETMFKLTWVILEGAIEYCSPIGDKIQTRYKPDKPNFTIQVTARDINNKVLAVEIIEIIQNSL